MTVSIEMGVTSSGVTAILDLEELLATRLLVQGNSGSGKSHLLRRLIEQSAASVQQTIIDPEGDFVTLAESFGHVVIDAAAHTEGVLQQIANRARQHRVSTILNLENLDVDMQMRHSAAFLGGLFEADRDFWYPMLVVVDEAQLFAPAAAGEVSDEARKASLGAMTNLMCRGRKRGLAGVIATQRLAKLAKNVAAEASNFLMGRTFLDIDMARAADLLGMERKQAEMFRDLRRGHFIALGPALSRRPLPVRIGEVVTSGRSGSPKLMPLPEVPEDARDLLLTPGEGDALRPVVRRTAPSANTDILLQLVRARPVVSPAPLPQVVETPADREAALDEVVKQVLADSETAFRPIAVLYQDFLVRCRSQNVNGRMLDLAGFRRKLTAARAATADGSDWGKAIAAAADLPEDIQGVFLLLARSALENAPCPPDSVIALARGSSSARRARVLLTYMEQLGVVVTRTEPDGCRVIALPSLGWETQPGDPDAAEELPASGGDDQIAEAGFARP